MTEKNVTFFRSYLRSLSAPPIQLAFSGLNSRSYLLVQGFSSRLRSEKPTSKGQKCLRIPAPPSYMAAYSDRVYVGKKNRSLSFLQLKHETALAINGEKVDSLIEPRWTVNKPSDDH